MNKIYLTVIIGLLSSLLLSSCANQSIKEYSQIKPGDYLVLKRSINISPDSARVFIQNGINLSRSGYNRYDQHCRLEVKNLSSNTQTILNGRYQISSITIDEELIATNPVPIQLAANTSIGIYTDFSTIGGYVGIGIGATDFERPETMDLVHLYLQNPSYTNILRLTCAGALSNGSTFDEPESYRPNLSDINRILGYLGYIELQN